MGDCFEPVKPKFPNSFVLDIVNNDNITSDQTIKKNAGKFYQTSPFLKKKILVLKNA